MKQWYVLFKNENLAMWRNYKWLWVPLVFIMLGVMQPLSTYYLPEILESMGGLPEGTVIDIPLPSGEQVMVETLSQYGTIGILILVLALMGIVSSERQSGAITMVIVKPVPYITYILAKWAGAVLLTSVSFIVGVGSAAYYTVILFDTLPIIGLIQSTLTYGLWLIFIVSLTVLFSTFLRGSGAVAFVSLITVVLLTIVTSIFSWLMSWSPATLSGQAGTILLNGSFENGFAMALVMTVFIIVAALASATYIFKHLQFAK